MRASHRLWRVAAAAREAVLGPAQIRPGLRVLCYHAVGTNIPGDTYGLSIAPDAFHRQMKRIASGCFGRPTTLGAARLDGEYAEIAVTFDDGYASIRSTAAPILVELKIPFTVCATAAFVSGGAAPHLSLSDLRALASVPGVEIGAHGANHLKMAECGDEELARELAESKTVLENVLCAAVTVMTWPHGSASRRTAAYASRAGFVRAGCSLYGVNEPGRNPLLLKRTEITGFDSEADFARKCSGAWDWYALRQADPADT